LTWVSSLHKVGDNLVALNHSEIKEALIIVNIHFVGCYVEYGKKSDIK
jgi:hypothetical protein